MEALYQLSYSPVREPYRALFRSGERTNFSPAHNVIAHPKNGAVV